MGPIFEVLLIIVGEDVIDIESFGPRIDEPLLGPFEVIFDVTLTANKGAHLLARRARVDVIVFDSLRGFETTHAFNEPRAA